MNKKVMNRDSDEPAFLPCEKQVPQAPAKSELLKSQLIRWRLRQLFGIVLLVAILYGSYSFLSKILTPEVLAVIGIIAGFFMLRWIIRIILRIAFTIATLVFWIIFICFTLFIIL